MLDSPPLLTSLLRDAFARYADQVAVRAVGTESTYAQLDTRSQAIAEAVAHATADATEPVAILAPYDADVVAAAVGVVRSGHPSVILDPVVPHARMQQIVTLARAHVVVTVTALQAVAAAVAPGATLLVLDDLPGAAPETALADVGPAALAAIVFTSGSSGQPKGVMWSHGLVAGDCEVLADGIGYRNGDRVALSLPVSFAAGFNVMFAALSRGCCLELRDPRGTGGQRYVRWLAEVGATVVHLTPSLLRGLGVGPDGAVPTLRVVTLVGEAAFGTDVVAARELSAGRAEVRQWLGSSETGTVTFSAVGPDDDVPAGLLPAGHATPGRSLRVLGDDGEPVGPGEPGELVVTSTLHADGYWADPEGTARKFTIRDDGRWDIRMGDVATIGSDGVVRLVGRAEAAVKVRGYLVDPSEIEATLLTVEEVAEAVVIPRQEDGGTVLVAYVAPRAGGRTPSVVRLREHLSGRLPTWMIPRHVLVLDALPRNDRGKVDRQALPPVPERTVVAAQTEWEEQIAALWATALGTDAVGRTDDFFALGGDSLSGEEMLQRLEERAGVRLASEDLIRASRLDAFAALVEATAEVGQAAPAPAKPGWWRALRGETGSARRGRRRG